MYFIFYLKKKKHWVFIWFLLNVCNIFFLSPAFLSIRVFISLFSNRNCYCCMCSRDWFVLGKHLLMGQPFCCFCFDYYLRHCYYHRLKAFYLLSLKIKRSVLHQFQKKKNYKCSQDNSWYVHTNLNTNNK